MLIERVEEWSREIEKKSLKKGRKEGLEKGREEGLEKGLKQGLEDGLREVLLRQLEVKFGEIDDRARTRVRAAGPERLLRWAERLVTAERLTDVFRR